mgnify:CR=1 FL=1
MIRLNLPSFEIKLGGDREHPQVYDPLRRRYVALTPEEWVRQHFIHHLIADLGYPAALMANEVQLHVGRKSLRADSVLYNRGLSPRMIIEYKAPTVTITQKVFDQIMAYNLQFKAPYLVVSGQKMMKNIYLLTTFRHTKIYDILEFHFDVDQRRLPSL